MDVSSINQIHIEECLYYIRTYGNHLMLVNFYCKHDMVAKALQYVLDKVSMIVLSRRYCIISGIYGVGYIFYREQYGERPPWMQPKNWSQSLLKSIFDYILYPRD